MKELNLSTKRGKEVYIMGSSCGFTDIRDLYKNPSKAKKEAFEKCWLENVMIVKTRCNDYLVWLER